MLIISFDAVSDTVFKDKLLFYPNISSFAKTAEVRLGVETVFLSNTYPTHCSIATGLLPKDHGVISNTEPFPDPNPKWTTEASLFKSKPLWQSASEAGLKVAAVLWPVTCGSPHIRYNIPEVHIQPGENQVRANLKAGSKLLQLDVLLRYKSLLKGEKQPELDDFITSCAAYILKKKKPALTFVHLICFDAFSHRHGPYSDELEPAFESLDKNLGRLLQAAGDKPVMIVSDHACVSVHTCLNPNDMLYDMGLAEKCFFECCGGSAFFYPCGIPENVTIEVKEKVAGSVGFSRFLTESEMRDSGRTALPFGYGLMEGYMVDHLPCDHKGTHGYPTDMPDYRVFYAVRGDGFSPGKTSTGGSILDINSIAKKMLRIG